MPQNSFDLRTNGLRFPYYFFIDCYPPTDICLHARNKDYQIKLTKYRKALRRK